MKFFIIPALSQFDKADPTGVDMGVEGVVFFNLVGTFGDQIPLEQTRFVNRDLAEAVSLAVVGEEGADITGAVGADELGDREGNVGESHFGIPSFPLGVP